MDLKDATQSFKNVISARLRNKAIVSLLITLLAFNWRSVLIILFSEMNMRDRLNYISENYLNNPWLQLIPVGVAIGYYLGYPYLNNWFERILKKANDKRVLRERIVQENTLDHEEMVAKRLYRISAAKAGTFELEELNNKIREQETIITSKNKNIAELEAVKKSFINDIETLKSENKELDLTNHLLSYNPIMSYLVNKNIDHQLIKIFSILDTKNTKTTLENLDKNIKSSLLTRNILESNNGDLRLTEKGKAFFDGAGQIDSIKKHYEVPF